MSSACLAFPAFLRWELLWLLIEETLTRRRGKEKFKKRDGHILLPDIKLSECGTQDKSNSLLQADTWTWSSVQSRASLHLVTRNFIVSLTSVLFWLECFLDSELDAVFGIRSSTCPPMLREEGKPNHHPFSGSLVYSGWKRTATGLQPSVLQKPGGSWCYACTPPVWHFALAWQQQTSSQMFKKVLPKVLGVDPQ